ncbi:MAG TPA: GNAT family N-acetyltransferase, partial [Actinomycetes bacterium]|nr:GNAT family N-acetyltransferase [Actinomycetes bacterium]
RLSCMQRKVRAASKSDREVILDVCTAAFVTEPAFDHFFQGAYDPHAREFLAYLLDLRLAGGLVWVEEVDGRVVSASMWDPPGGATVPEEEQEAMWSTTTAKMPADAVDRLANYDERVHKFGPSDDHYYLGVLASDPSVRGRGHGAAVLRPGLVAADAEGLMSFLETGTEGNLGFYARFGFEVTGELDLDDGTHVWCLTRPPGASLG